MINFYKFIMLNLLFFISTAYASVNNFDVDLCDTVETSKSNTMKKSCLYLVKSNVNGKVHLIGNELIDEINNNFKNYDLLIIPAGKEFTVTRAINIPKFVSPDSGSTPRGYKIIGESPFDATKPIITFDSTNSNGKYLFDFNYNQDTSHKNFSVGNLIFKTIGCNSSEDCGIIRYRGLGSHIYNNDFSSQGKCINHVLRNYSGRDSNSVPEGVENHFYNNKFNCFESFSTSYYINDSVGNKSFSAENFNTPTDQFIINNTFECNEVGPCINYRGFTGSLIKGNTFNLNKEGSYAFSLDNDHLVQIIDNKFTSNYECPIKFMVLIYSHYDEDGKVITLLDNDFSSTKACKASIYIGNNNSIGGFQLLNASGNGELRCYKQSKNNYANYKDIPLCDSDKIYQ
ncbi:hypothetical protein MTF68_05155 [Pseudoalteromonas sp. 2CM37A]|uniref:hypothetical protein n=1 Tax=Pseudoalteromonas sp. 2CM37A TaxID=2929853 RepID=UPI0020C0E7F4|nr:hypothetical protein [Pseudoalteromonas sp. 2CM37A]MCK8116940.1 hypothetical protein [Pseudoalteromonas sp. 2CM37A]